MLRRRTCRSSLDSAPTRPGCIHRSIVVVVTRMSGALDEALDLAELSDLLDESAPRRARR